MQKIRCPRCGVVNLEQFITYPQCAGCGSTLPTPRTSALPFWKKPLGSWLWLAFVGGALALVLAAASWLQVPEENNETAVFYGTAARRGLVGGLIVLSFTVDVVAPSRRNEVLKNVRLRLPLQTFQNLRFVSIYPPPDAMTISGSSRYFIYYTLPRESMITLRLRAVASGNRRSRATLYADEFLPADWRFRVAIAPAPRVLVR